MVSDWYGDTILYVDVAIVVAAVPTFGVALVAYPLGGPIAHLAHGNYGRAAGSLALRAGLPILGVAIATSATCASARNSDSDLAGLCYVAPVLVGSTIGALSAIAIDSAVLAWDSAPSPSERTTGFRIVPTFAPLEGGATAGVVGTF